MDLFIMVFLSFLGFFVAVAYYYKVGKGVLEEEARTEGGKK